MKSPDEIKQEREARLKSLQTTVTSLRLEADELLNHIQLHGFSERQLEIVKWGYDLRIYQVNSEICAVRKKLGLPTQGQMKKAKKAKNI